jgi:hypothetical protein
MTTAAVAAAGPQKQDYSRSTAAVHQQDLWQQDCSIWVKAAGPHQQDSIRRLQQQDYNSRS